MTTEHVSVRTSDIEGAGRGVFANKDFQAGDLILSLARPMVAELNVERLIDTCSWCCQKAITDPVERSMASQMGVPAASIELKSCLGCKKIRYCSKTCQSKDWKLEHKYECKFWAARPSLPAGVRAVYKLLKRLEKGDEAVKGMLDFQDVREEARRFNPKTYNDLTELAFGTWKYADETADQNTASHLFFTVICNTIGLTSAVDDSRLGFGWDPLLCSVNHSCEPNAFYLFNQPRTILRASRKIAKGEEITIRYCDVHNPWQIRQEELRSSYLFDCMCKKCKKGAASPEDKFERPIEDLDRKWAAKADALLGQKSVDINRYRVGMGVSQTERRMSALQAVAFRISRPGGVRYPSDRVDEEDASEEDLKRTLRMCLDTGMWSLTRQPVPTILERLFSPFFHTQQLEQALHVGLVRHFVVDPVLGVVVFADRMLDTFALAQVAGSFSSPERKQREQELRKAGCDMQMLYLSLLWTCWQGLDKSYGKDSAFGQVVAQKWHMSTGGITALPDEAITKLRKAHGPLQKYAVGINILEWIK